MVGTNKQTYCSLQAHLIQYWPKSKLHYIPFYGRVKKVITLLNSSNHFLQSISIPNTKMKNWLHWKFIHNWDETYQGCWLQLTRVCSYNMQSVLLESQILSNCNINIILFFHSLFCNFQLVWSAKFLSITKSPSSFRSR